MEFDPTYNTLMAVGVGLSLVLLAALGRRFVSGSPVHRQAWAAPFLAVGAILTFLGGVMTVTWPLTGPVAFDNIVFGEPTLACGVLLLAGGFLLGSDRFWRKSDTGAVAGYAPESISTESWARLSTLFQPLSWFAFVMGLALVSIAFVGPFFTPWEAPPTEPISGEFANVEWLENSFISLLYLVIAVGCLLLPFALSRTLERAKGLLRVIGIAWAISGIVLTLFGSMNFYTHIGLTINTYEESQQQTDAEATIPSE
ncbi:MAG: DUF981 domain-containing protein [Actinomycetota bacterium]|nr:DUF981 domain-containing protein [Actinomycetota bacterium]